MGIYIYLTFSLSKGHAGDHFCYIFFIFLYLPHFHFQFPSSMTFRVWCSLSMFSCQWEMAETRLTEALIRQGGASTVDASAVLQISSVPSSQGLRPEATTPSASDPRHRHDIVAHDALLMG